MQINEKDYAKLPAHLQVLFRKLPNPGSDEVVALFPQAGGGFGKRGGRAGATVGDFGMGATMETVGYGDTGSAARFFYCAKASKSDRDAGLEGMEPGQGALRNAKGRPMNPLCVTTGKRVQDCDCKPTCDWERPEPTSRNTHPTVKPTDLMRYLCRLVTPPGGTVLDPFCGSGSTGKAALLEGFDFIGIELSPEYIEIARRRIGASDLPLFQERVA